MREPGRFRRFLRGAGGVTAFSIACVAFGAAEDPAHAEGRALYRANDCAGCHEYAAIPGMEVRPLARLGERYDVAALSALLASPPDPMPDFGLSDEERLALAHYLLARFP